MYNDKIYDEKKKKEILFNLKLNKNAFHYIACWDDVNAMIDEIDQFSMGIFKNKNEMRNTRSSNDGCTPFMLACQNNKLECAKQFITQDNVNMTDNDKDKDNSGSPLYYAIYFGNDQIVQFLCKLINSNEKENDNNKFKVEVTKNDLHLCVEKGNTRILCLLLLAKIKGNKINDMETLEKYNILNVKIINEWLNQCKIKGNWSM